MENLLVADEVWIALALLHRGNPERKSFSAKEILTRVKTECAHPALRPGVQTHIGLHTVANIPPNSGQIRMLYRLPDRTYRLFRPGDDFHPRRGGKTKPDRSDLPSRYHELLAWYEDVYCRQGADGEDDPVLAMRGVGKELWHRIGGDRFILELRLGWGPEPPAARRKRRSRIA